VTRSLADVELARDARRFGWRQFARAAAAVHCQCLTEMGQLDLADRELTADSALEEPRDLEDVARLSARAELRLAQGRADDALADALASGQAIGSSIVVMGQSQWRATAALAALALGDREQARELAREDGVLAEQTGVLHARIRALRVQGICEQGESGLRLLRSAAELAAGSPPRLETIRALLELGAALRRANQRAVAREPLQRAADMAHSGGATALYARARTELAASGARPRRDALLSGPASLTASERRIAGLAAAGQSNREIAQALFVTPKTVEYHLRNVYRKLDIEGRGDLGRMLGP
jgi:DNA-binding CsgD family transcriptional regulator